LNLGGVCLGRGYWNRPDLTAERFTPNPCGREPGARLYKTGDLARFRPSGAVEWLGRGDGQIKIRGFRVELGEIEAALHGCPDVRQAAVTLAEPRPGDQRLQAYIVPVKGRKPAAAELMSALRARLPDYMIPSSYTLLDALPLTPNGKVDHRALPSPDGSGSASGPGYASPRTETERMIASVWSEVLGVAQVGLHDNFFDLGGHSLLIVRVHGRLEKLLGDPPPLIDFFRYPTVASLAGRIAHGPADESGTLERAEQRARRQLEA